MRLGKAIERLDDGPVFREPPYSANRPWTAGFLRWVFRFLGLTFAAAQTFAALDTINSDGRSYLEVSRAYLRHDWTMAANSYWSPLYSWVLAPFLAAVKPSLRREYPLVHGVNLGLFVVSMVTFEFFWSGLLAYRKVRNDSSAAQRLPDSVLWIVGYTVFVWLMGGLLPLVSPDLTLAAVVLGATGLLLRMVSSDDPPIRLYLYFGLLLGIGYLIKAVMFPMSFVFLTTLLACRKRNLVRVGLACALFLAISTPEIAWLSAAKGYPTFSGTGKLAYAWYDYDLPLLNWQGRPAWTGVPVHPTRKVYSHPDVFEFNGPIRSSYPPWYDPTYWNEGLAPRFQFATVVKHFLKQALSTLWMWCVPRPALVGLVVFILFADLRGTLKQLLRFWPLLGIMAAVSAAYCLTLALPRYYAPWIMLLWGVLLAAVRLRPRFSIPRFYLSVAVGISILTFASQTKWINWQLHHAREDDARPEYATAEGLKEVGLHAGEKVAAIGFDEVAHWAYLDGLSIVAEINSWDACEFWNASPSTQAQVLNKFRQSGATAVVANTGGGMLIRTRHGTPTIDQGACARPTAGWQRIQGSANHVYFLR